MILWDVDGGSFEGTTLISTRARPSFVVLLHVILNVPDREVGSRTGDFEYSVIAAAISNVATVTFHTNRNLGK